MCLVGVWCENNKSEICACVHLKLNECIFLEITLYFLKKKNVSFDENLPKKTQARVAYSVIRDTKNNHVFYTYTTTPSDDII